ncbi:hypothetical protein ACHQM5_020016 [Ranunculus cassubicifolius]
MKKSVSNRRLVVLAPMIVILNLIHAQPYLPTDKILLNCGATGETTDSNNRMWSTDKGSKYAPKEENTITDTALSQAPSVATVPYMTARIFDSEFTYSFPVAVGRKAVRLYFYPASYSGRQAANAVFDVTSGKFTLMRNFSALQTVQALNYDYMIKEYYVNVVDERLNITFKPLANASSSYAFVNGIEVVSMPDIYNTLSGNAMIIGQTQPFIIDNSTNLENLYRLNVGGSDLSVNDDTGMFRLWSGDSLYIFAAQFGVTDSNPNLTIKYAKGIPSYVAPTDIYTTARTMGPSWQINRNYNLSWIFTVDPGFYYLVRLHFCEIEANITEVNQRMFKIFINNQTAEEQADAVLWTGGNGIATYKDYVVLVPRGSDRQDLWLQMHPSIETKSTYYDAILNGVEIFKANDTRGNLAGLNPSPLKTQDSPPSVPRTTSSGSFKHKGVIAGSVIGGLIAIVLLLALVVTLRRRRVIESSATDGHSGWTPLSLFGSSHSGKSSKTSTTVQSYGSSLPSNLCRHFSFAEIEIATNNFDDALILGVGGFGKVYKGEVDGGATKVAIKRGNTLSGQGVNEFQTEIEMLSKLRHLHLVSLIGYCEENSEMILVYDYMAYGTLREHLYRTQKPPLPWKKRLQICIGAARGLHYLHTGAKHTIIHRDVKTTNILLDEKWVAKVSDFGLSKTGPALDNTHVSTVVKGSFGYLDPEYFRRHQLTEKSDVYSFGVVLFEVLCARPALNRSLANEQVSLAEWALHCQKKGTLAHIIDPYLDGKIAPECFKEFTETAEKCVADNGIERPAMSDVLWHLEFALQLQESADEYGGIKVQETEEAPLRGKNAGNSDMLFDSNVNYSRSRGISMSIGSRSLASEDSDGLTPSAVFSQIMNPKGR